MQESENQRKL